MSHTTHDHGGAPHSHGAGVTLEPAAAAVLKRGLIGLLRLTEGLDFRPIVSERYPLPLCLAVYGEVPETAVVRAAVSDAVDGDPLDGLEAALVLLELYAAGQAESTAAVPGDSVFLGLAFGSKRLNGWIAVLGQESAADLERAINARWKFRFITAGEPRLGLYVLLNTLARYAYIYGRIPFGDPHDMGHFIEEFTPGLLLCRPGMDDIDTALALAAAKLGVPAIVPPDYPFPLGRQVRALSLDDAQAAFPRFTNIRRLLDLPEIPRLPDFLDPARARETVRPALTWGDTSRSYYLLRKGDVPRPGVDVVGKPSGSLGVLLTAEAEPLDAFDRRYLETRAAAAVSMLEGVSGTLVDGRLVVGLSRPDACSPRRLGEALIALLRHEFPRIRKLHAEISFDAELLAVRLPDVEAERAARAREIAATTEETLTDFVTCVGCSPFAPDHVCILTPERPPQCGRPYEQIRTGALYAHDDMTNIHHRILHSGLNSHGLAPRREPVDLLAGEWVGVNEAVWRLSGGRTRRVQLHALGDAPHTGCGCFRIIMFRTGCPREGVGVMDRAYKGKAPDGRTWSDLHHALAGKQAPGIAGASPAYLSSPKFLAAEGGWGGVVWVSPAVAGWAGVRLPSTVEVGGPAKPVPSA